MNRFMTIAIASLVIATASAVELSAQSSTVPTTYPAEVSKLTALAWQYRNQGDSGLNDAKALGQYVAQKYATDSAAGQVNWDDWSGLASAIAPYLPDATRTTMAQDLVQKFASTTDAVKLLTGGKLQGVASTLKALGQSASASSLCATWINSSDAYKSMTSDNLGDISGLVTGSDDASKSARQRLIDLVQTKYLADPAAARTVSCGNWNRIIRGFAGDLSADQVSQWIAGIRAAYPNSSDVWSGLKYSDITAIYYALEKLGDKDAPGFLAAFVNGGTSWQSWPAEELRGLIYDLCKGTTDACKTARSAVALRAQSAFMTDAAAVRKAGIVLWETIAGHMGQELSPDTRSAIASKLREAFATDQPTLAAMSAAEFQRLAGVLRQLGDTGVSALASSLVTGCTTWQSWKPQDVLCLAQLVGTGEGGTGARQALMSFVNGKLLVDATSTKSLAILDWGSLYHVLRGDFDPQTTNLWAAHLHEAYAPAAAGMTGTEFHMLLSMLQFCGDSGVPQMVETLVNGGTSWQSWDAPTVVRLAQIIREDYATDAGMAARGRLVGHIQNRILADVKSTQAVSLRSWPYLATLLAQQSADVRSADARALVTAFGGSSEALSALKADDFRALVDAVTSLDSKQASALVLAYLAGPDSRAGAPGELTVAVSLAAAGDKTAMTGMLADLDKQWQDQNAQTPIGWKDCQAIATAWRSLGNMPKAQDWAMKAYNVVLGTDEARISADVRTLANISSLLEHVKLTGTGKGYSGFAQAATRLIRDGQLDRSEEYLTMAIPLGTPETRQIVQNDLTDAGGALRLAAAKVLAWAYSEAGQIDDWRKTLDAKLGDSNLAGDEKARRLMARAYAESLASGEFSPLAGKKWLDDALVAASTEGVRLDVVETLAGGFAQIGRHDTALDFLDSVAGQFTSDDGASKIAALKDQIRQAKTQYAVAKTASKARQERAIQQAWISELQRRLAAAQSRGDNQEVQRLKKILGQ
ncbi:MAG: hypothetical protein ACE15C_20930 [Phycisphaerae bacterium]